MRPLSEFLDYREYLAEYYRWRKSENPRFSYRVLAARLDMNVSQLYRILNKRLHLPYTHLAKVCEALGLDEKGSSHFELLVKYGRTHSKKERLGLVEQILARREVDLRKLKDDEFKAFAAWYAPVVRALTQVKGFDGSIGRIADRLVPQVAEQDVRESFESLVELGFLRCAPDGRWELSETHLTSGSAFHSEAVKEYTKRVLMLASESVERFPREERDISTLTVGVDKATLKDIAEMVRECRRQIQRRVEECHRVDRVAQVAFAIFPVTTVDAVP
jgi:uncharacterized protein (TIGR02147 family)